MYQFFVFNKLSVKDIYSFNNDDSHHIKNVLRLSKNEVVRLVYDGLAYFAYIDYDGKKPVAIVKEVDEVSHELGVKITLIQSLIKLDKWDLVLQKACELGVSTIVPLYTSRVNIKKDIIENKKDRFNKIIMESCKQCKRELLPNLTGVIDLNKIDEFKSDINLFAYEIDNINDNQILNYIEKGKSVSIVIGCEGGFSESEAIVLKDKGFIPVSLGRRILRAETASMYALSVVGSVNEVKR